MFKYFNKIEPKTVTRISKSIVQKYFPVIYKKFLISFRRIKFSTVVFIAMRHNSYKGLWYSDVLSFIVLFV